MTHFVVENLKRDQLLDAWPVVRMSTAEVHPEWWINDAKLLIGRGGGVLAARGPDCRVHGIATYEPVKDRYRGKILAVEELITFELSTKAPARRALCDALDDLSLALGCDGIALGMPAQEPASHLSQIIA